MGWGVGGGVGMLLFWILAIAAVVWLVRESGLLDGRSGRAHDGNDRALETLRERYARGEIDGEEFERRRRELERSPR